MKKVVSCPPVFCGVMLFFLTFLLISCLILREVEEVNWVWFFVTIPSLYGIN